jgi:pyruvate kinase
MKKTKIVCTIGPASDAPEILEKLILGGMNVARVNFSHGSHEENKKRFDALKTARQKLEKNVAIMLDNKGPEIRIKQFAASPITLEDGARFALVCEDVAGTQDEVSVTYANLCNEVRPGLLILIDDGLIRLRVEKIEGKRIITTLENGGALSNTKSINIPDPADQAARADAAGHRRPHIRRAERHRFCCGFIHTHRRRRALDQKSPQRKRRRAY